MPGGRLPLPAGDFAFAYPQAIIDRAGTYHLFWAEFRDREASRRDWPPTASSVWYAAYANGSWSPPTRLIEGLSVWWEAGQGQVALDSSGNVHVVVPSLLNGEGFALAHLAHLVLHGGAWRTEHVPVQALYASIAATRTHLVLLVVAPDSAAPSTVRLFARRTDSDTGSWGPRRPLTGPDARYVAHVIALGGRDAVGALWTEGGGRGGDRLHYATSLDGGDSWTDGPSVPVDAVRGSLRATMTRCGPTVIGEAFQGRGPQLRVVLRELRLRGSLVPSARAVYPQFLVAIAGAVTTIGDSVVLVFGAVRDSTASPSVEIGRRPACGQ